MTRASAGALLFVLSLALVGEPAHADFVDHFATGGDVGLMKVPRSGEVPILVIPVVVDDLPGAEGFEDEVRAFFAPDAHAPSFVAYYRVTSRDRYRPQPIVAPAVHLPSCPRMGAYTGCAIPRGAGLPEGDLGGAIEVLRDAFDLLDEIFRCAVAGPGPGLSCVEGGGVELARFDRSGAEGVPDGFLDGVIVVSNAPFPGIALPVKWLVEAETLQSEERPLPSFVYGGLTVSSVAISGDPEVRVANAVSIHEHGHLLGFADLYNEVGSTIDLPYSLMGGWDYTSPPPLLDPFSRARIGWANVRQVNGEETIRLGPAVETGEVLKIGTGEEIFFVEYRTRTPWIDGDLSVPGGVLVERVRLPRLPAPQPGKFINTLMECVNCERWDPLTLIEQADGRHDLQLKTRGREDAEDLFLAMDAISSSTDTAPRSDDHLVFSTNALDGHPTGIAIRVLELTEDHAVIRVVTASLADGCAELAAYCEGFTCGAGLCGDTGAPPAEALALLEPAADGCGCHISGGLQTSRRSGPLLVLALPLLRLGRRLVKRRACVARPS